MILSKSSLNGALEVPPSKSLYHRALICSALSGKIVGLPNNASKDLKATYACMELINKARQSVDTATTLFCGESGTTLRLLVPIVAALGLDCVFIGEGRLPKRPLLEYKDCLVKNGAVMQFPDSGEEYLPLRLSGKLYGGEYRMRGDISSQYISGLILALSLLEDDSRIVLTTTLESVSYVDMTISVMKEFGVDCVEKTDFGFIIRGSNKYLQNNNYVVEADYSQAAFWLLAKQIGHNIEISNLNDKSIQGDSIYAKLLDEMRSTSGNIVIDAKDIPDIVPALSAAAVFRNGVTDICNVARLRIKESDRIESTCNMLKAFGVNISSTTDKITVVGMGDNATLKGCTIDSYNDHRIVMTAAILSTVANSDVEIKGAEAVSKSYPNFFDEFARLGGKVL